MSVSSFVKARRAYEIFPLGQLGLRLSIELALQVMVCKLILETLDVGFGKSGDKFIDSRVEVLQGVSSIEPKK